MAKLTEQELQYLNKEIEREGLTYTELQKELLDHLCCDVEARMDEGIEFLKALDEVKMEMGKDCIRHIQEDTLLLINKKYLMMKKFMYILGVIAPTLVIIGTYFKVQHWPGASVLLTLGLFLLGAIYLPVFVSIKIRDTRKEGKALNKAVYIIGLISGIVFIAGAMFKTMHWPGAQIMIVLSGVFAVGVFIPVLVVHALRSRENQVNNFTLLIFVMSFIAIFFMTFSLRVPKGVMDAFIIGVEDNIRTEQILHENNTRLLQQFPINAYETNAVAIELRELTDELNAYLDEIIVKLIVNADDENLEDIGEDGSINYYELGRLEDMNAFIFLIVEEEGKVLQNKLEEYRKYASQLVSSSSANDINRLLDTSPQEYEDHTITWLSSNFEHLPMITAVTKVLSIQANIRIVEGEVLGHLLQEMP